jgi:hypothetical protein
MTNSNIQRALEMFRGYLHGASGRGTLNAGGPAWTGSNIGFAKWRASGLPVYTIPKP